MLCSPADRRGEGHLPALSAHQKRKAQASSLTVLSKVLMSTGKLLPQPLAEMNTQLKNKDFNVKTLWKQPPKKKGGGLGGKEEAELHSIMVE